MAAIMAFFRNGQRLVQRRVGVGRTARVDQGTAEKPEIIGQRQRGAGGAIGVETPDEAGERLQGLSLQQRAAGLVDNPRRMKQRKPLVCREA